MNTTITSTPLRGLVATAIFGALGLGFASLCNASDTTEAREVTVQYADLNVSSSHGAATLYGRIRTAAEAVCSPLSHGDLSSKMHREACVSQSIAAAVSKVNQGALFAVYNAKSAQPLPRIVAAEQPR
jgi:UrcA family protein